MLHASSSSIIVGLLIATASGCNQSSAAPSDGKPGASAAPAATGTRAGGKMTFGSKTFEIKSSNYAIGSGQAYVKGDNDDKTLELRLFSTTLAEARACGYEIKDSGHAVKADQLALVLKTDDLSGKPGKTEKVEYTVYYRPPGDKEGTNSGDRRDSTLTISEWNDREVRGTFKLAGSMDIDAEFVARVCKENAE
jgi:hypothetical protein